MQIALYARVSTSRQADNDLSIPDQLRQMRQWAERNGHVVVKEYIEPGNTATDDKRPVFQDMMADATMKAGKWEKNSLTGLELWKKKVGIVGFGRIGQIVAKRISGFEPEILFFDPVLMSSDLPNTKKVNDLKEIFSTCDIITLHTPLMPQTKGMITAELLNLMKKDAILVNASRGGIVDEDSLYTVLKEKKIRGAGFDVFAVEPLPADSKLLELTNLVMSPHVGASTEEAQFRVGEMAVFQINEFFKNNNLLNEVKAK